MPYHKIKPIFIIQIFLLIFIISCAVSTCMAEKQDVFFYNKTDSKIIKCFKIKGKHDAFPVIKCYDKEGDTKEFDPGKTWEQVEVKWICFEYTGKDESLKDSVKTRCIKIQDIQGNIIEYRCMDEDEKMQNFDPGLEWKEISLDDDRCETGEPEDILKSGTQTSENKNYVEIQVFYGTDRNRTGKTKAEKFYGGKRGKLEYGTCKIKIPQDHKVGEIENDVKLFTINPQSSTAFFTDLSSIVKKSDRKQAFVFIHGYNSSFEKAAQRTAQMAYDLKFDGAPIFYSWPSRGTNWKYTVDETNVKWAIPNLKKFLEDIALKTDAQDIHLIAHSMGNRALTNALSLFADQPVSNNKAVAKFKEIVLTAPDIDAGIFTRDIAPKLISLNKRITLYVSSKDKALRASRMFHGFPRAGDSAKGLVIVKGIDTIDSTAVNTSFMSLGHSYYGKVRPVISDIYYLLNTRLAPDERFGLEQVEDDKGTYWLFAK
ncbi:alpha/beta hydrolase [Desulfobacterales bacterium HSG17]|nr:alpha/beta hydrolase [Desulfobacterales bacterium HSG17]